MVEIVGDPVLHHPLIATTFVIVAQYAHGRMGGTRKRTEVASSLHAPLEMILEEFAALLYRPFLVQTPQKDVLHLHAARVEMFRTRAQGLVAPGLSSNI